MHRTRAYLASAFLFFAAACSSPMDRGPEPPPGLENVVGYAILRPGVAACGQPGFETLDGLRSAGYKTVVNLRMASEDPSPIEEGEKLRQLGLDYVHIPM